VKKVGDVSGKAYYIEENEFGSMVFKAVKKARDPFFGRTHYTELKISKETKLLLSAARSAASEHGIREGNSHIEPIVFMEPRSEVDDVLELNERIESGDISRQELMDIVDDDSFSDAVRFTALDALDYVDPAAE